MGVKQRSREISVLKIKKKNNQKLKDYLNFAGLKHKLKTLARKVPDDVVSKWGHSQAWAYGAAGTALGQMPDLLACLPVGI